MFSSAGYRRSAQSYLYEDVKENVVEALTDQGNYNRSQ